MLRFRGIGRVGNRSGSHCNRYSCKIDSKSPQSKKTPAPSVDHFVKVEGFFRHVVKPSKTLGITITQLYFTLAGPLTRQNHLPH